MTTPNSAAESRLPSLETEKLAVEPSSFAARSSYLYNVGPILRNLQPRLKQADSHAATSCLTFVLLYLMWYAMGGLQAHFSPDDMQPMYGYWRAGTQACIEAILTFWSTFYRPVGSLFYMPLFYHYGFDPFPYRLVILGLLTVNVVLFGAFCLVVSRRWFVVWVALSIWIFHQALFLAYYSNAIIYEILCFLFYMSGMTWYARRRLSGGHLRITDIVLVFVLYILALDAKEMAVSLPLGLLLLEVIVVWRSYTDWSKNRRELLAIAGTALVTAAFLAGKIFGPDSLANVSAYKPDISIESWLRSMSWYTSQLLYLDGETLRWQVALAIWIVMIGVAVAFRSRLALFGVFFALVALLPVAFIEQRQGFVWYIPLTGLALAAGSVAEKCLGRLPTLRWAALPTVCLMLLPPLSLGDEQASLLDAQSVTWHVLQQIQDMPLELPQGSSVLVKNDPFQGYWDTYFILNLYFEDPSLKVAFTSVTSPEPRGDIRTNYDAVLRFDNGQLSFEQLLTVNTRREGWQRSLGRALRRTPAFSGTGAG